MIYPWIFGIGGAVLSAALFFWEGEGGTARIVEPPPVQAVEGVETLGNAIMVAGLCSVVCSLVWGISIVVVSINRRRRREGCHE